MLNDIILALGSIFVGLVLWSLVGTFVAAVMVLAITLVLIPITLVLGLMALPTILLFILLL